MSEYVRTINRADHAPGYGQAAVVEIPIAKRKCLNCKHKSAMHAAMNPEPRCALTGRRVSLATPACERWEQWKP